MDKENKDLPQDEKLDSASSSRKDGGNQSEKELSGTDFKNFVLGALRNDDNPYKDEAKKITSQTRQEQKEVTSHKETAASLTEKEDKAPDSSDKEEHHFQQPAEEEPVESRGARHKGAGSASTVPLAPEASPVAAYEKANGEQKGTSDIEEAALFSQEAAPETPLSAAENDAEDEAHDLPEAESQRSSGKKRLKKPDQAEVAGRIAQRKKEDKIVSKIVALVVGALVVIMLISGFAFYRYWQSGLKPLDKDNHKLVQVHIPKGSTNKEIGSILEKSKVIKSGFVFTYYVKMNNLTDFKAGYYQLQPDMTLNTIAKNLQKGGTDEPEALADARIIVPEGTQIADIATLIADNTKYSKKEFLALMNDKAFFQEMVKKYPKLLTSAASAKNVRYYFEGYLFPATYNYYEKESLKVLAEKMISQMDLVMNQYYAAISAKEGLTVHKVLTLSSLVEKEGVTDADRRNIAQVFFNRFAEGMPLQSDITVIYALEKHKVHLSINDTKVDSPYNLYLHKGYGPGPFNSPSENAVAAVLNPELNDYLYFVADTKTGKVYFAKTYEEHLKQKEEYVDSQISSE